MASQRLGLALVCLASCASSPTPPPGWWGPDEFALERRCQQGVAFACGQLGTLQIDRSLNDRDLERGIVLLEIGCGHGDAMACTALGLTYGRLLKGEQARPRAIDVLTRACEQRYPAACTALGEVLMGGPARDRPHGRESMQTGCRLGDARGCELYGLAHAGNDFGSNAAVAEEFLALACGRGRRSGCHHLAVVRMRDPARRARAFADLRDNCQRGHGPSCREVAAASAPLLGPEADCSRARPVALMACRSGDQEGCAIVAVCDERVDFTSAVQRLADACEVGTGLACLYWADAQSRAAAATPGGTPIDPKQIERAYAAACRAKSTGSKIGCARVAAAELAAATSAEAAEEPLSVLRRSCGESVGDACCALAREHDGGRWVPQEPAKASELRSKSCALGHQPCCPPRETPLP
jgi:TPR repeat protein